MLFACSGGAEVGELTDLVTRKLFRDGSVVMSCPAAIGGRVQSVMDRVKRAPKILVLDGCDKDCVCKTLELAGYEEFIHIRLSDLGLFKGKSRVDKATIDKIAEHVKRHL